MNFAVHSSAAKRVGLSRTEYLRRALEREGGHDAGPVTVDELKRFAHLASDLDDPKSCLTRGHGSSTDMPIGRRRTASNGDELANRIERGLIRICTVTKSEVGFSARTAADHRTLLDEPPLASMPCERHTPRIEDRAREMQRQLAERGQHRAPSIPDLLIAATAELAELTVLRLDKHFDLIADVAGQTVERLTIG